MAQFLPVFKGVIQSGQMTQYPLAYYTVVGIYVLLAGATSVAWRPESDWKAVWVGASWPAIMASVVSAAPAHPTA